MKVDFSHPYPGMTGERRKPQRGAALIIVLLLVATLSFVLLSITNIVTAGVRRASAERARSELLWRAAAAEQIASTIIEKTTSQSPAPAMAPGAGIFAEPLELPFENGEGSIIFVDATRCFNVNSLVTSGAGGNAGDPATIAQFNQLLEAAGAGGAEAERISAVIVDFIDTEPAPRPQGAEDNFYTLLPTPFRTADGPIASVSELRAMDGVTVEIYRRIAPYLCARKDNTPSKINANFLRPEQAPLIAGLLGGGTNAGEAQSAIGSPPPGGWATVPEPLNLIAGITTNSDHIEARINLELGERSMEQTLLFEVSPGQEPKLLARTFGDDF